LFVPLPLFASAWLGALTAGNWLPAAAPWGERMVIAVWVHAAAAFPWVVLIVGHGLQWVEPEMEEDALTAAGPLRVLERVTLPRCRAVIVAAGFWVAWQCATEITVTDKMDIRTFAEEV